MAKFDIDPELRGICVPAAPMNLAAIKAADLLMRHAPKGYDKKKVKVDYFECGGIKCHIITPLELIDEVTPVVFDIHGGGFVFRASMGYYYHEQLYACQAHCRVIGAEYSRAPKYPYPKAIDECVALFLYMIEHQNELKLDASRLVIAGDSAGASLAMDCYFALRQKGIEPESLMLIYPVVDHRMTSKSMQEMVDAPVWNSGNTKAMWELYLQGKEYHCPLERIDEFGAKNIYIENCQFDPLRDEAEELYLALKGKIPNLTFNPTVGTFHGYDAAKNAKVTLKAEEARVRFLKECFSHTK